MQLRFTWLQTKVIIYEYYGLHAATIISLHNREGKGKPDIVKGSIQQQNIHFIEKKKNLTKI